MGDTHKATGHQWWSIWCGFLLGTAAYMFGKQLGLLLNSAVYAFAFLGPSPTPAEIGKGYTHTHSYSYTIRYSHAVIHKLVHVASSTQLFTDGSIAW